MLRRGCAFVCAGRTFEYAQLRGHRIALGLRVYMLPSWRALDAANTARTCSNIAPTVTPSACPPRPSRSSQHTEKGRRSHGTNTIRRDFLCRRRQRENLITRFREMGNQALRFRRSQDNKGHVNPDRGWAHNWSGT